MKVRKVVLWVSSDVAGAINFNYIKNEGFTLKLNIPPKVSKEG